MQQGKGHLTLRESRVIAGKFKKYLEEDRMDKIRGLLSNPNTIAALIKVLEGVEHTPTQVELMTVDELACELMDRTDATLIAVEVRTHDRVSALKWVNGPVTSVIGLHSLFDRDNILNDTGTVFGDDDDYEDDDDAF